MQENQQKKGRRPAYYAGQWTKHIADDGSKYTAEGENTTPTRSARDEDYTHYDYKS